MRPPYFAQKYIRLLTKTAAALELGPSACWMLAVIATQEDAKRYTEPAKYYYDQLMPLCGFTSRKQLANAIRKSVALGWLSYTAGRKSIPCYFSVCIPKRFTDLDTNGCDESAFRSEFSSDSELQTELNKKSSSDFIPEMEIKGNRKGRTSIPSPTPNPNTYDFDASFDSWYAIYARKVARKPAARAYRKALGDIERSERVDAEEAAVMLLRWTKERMHGLLATEEKFRPHPATWLNNGRYRDALSVSQSVQPVALGAPETKRGDYVVKPKPRVAP